MISPVKKNVFISQDLIDLYTSSTYQISYNKRKKEVYGVFTIDLYITG